MNFFLLLPFFLVTCYGKYQDDDWIDPTDMLNYDAAAGRMKHQKQYQTAKVSVKDNSGEQAEGTCQSDHLDCKTGTNNWKQKDSIELFSEKEENKLQDESMFQECKEHMDTLKKEIEELRKKEGVLQSSCNPVFKRFLYRIINEAQLLGLPDESQPEVHYDVELVLTKQMVAEFLRFLDDTDWNAGPLDEALGATLVRFRHHNEEDWSWKFEDYVGTDPFTAFMICLSLLCLVMLVATELWTHIGWFTQIKRLFALSFLVSIVWNWMYLYRDAFAEQQATLTKIDNHACGKKISWSESLLAWWKSSSSFQNDPCEEYFKALMVNPIFMVPPTKAFAVTFTNFITEPLKQIGKGLGEFFHGLLAEMPLFYQPIVLIIIALLLLVFCYGFGTNIHRMNMSRRNNDDERERLYLPNPQREGYDRFIEGRDGRYHNPQPIPGRVEGHRDVLNLRPEVLHTMDYGDINDGQQEVKDFTDSISATKQPQRKQGALENKTHDQHTNDKSPRQMRSKDDPLHHGELGQQVAKKIPEDSSLECQDYLEKSLKDSEHLDKTSPIHQELYGSPTEVIENRLSDVETLVSLITDEVKLRNTSAEKGSSQQPLNENEPKDYLKNIPIDMIASAEHVSAQDITIYTVKSDPGEDLSTDPGNS